jgi:hypothetical protein
MVYERILRYIQGYLSVFDAKTELIVPDRSSNDEDAGLPQKVSDSY